MEPSQTKIKKWKAISNRVKNLLKKSKKIVRLLKFTFKYTKQKIYGLFVLEILPQCNEPACKIILCLVLLVLCILFECQMDIIQRQLMQVGFQNKNCFYRRCWIIETLHFHRSEVSDLPWKKSKNREILTVFLKTKKNKFWGERNAIPQRSLSLM